MAEPSPSALLGAAHDAALGPEARRQAGSWTTPQPVVERLLDLALEPLLDGAADPLALRVCDPACGTGQFLAGAARRLAGRLGGGAEAFAAAAERCLCGVERDPRAAALCRAALEQEAGRPLPGLRVLVGDALLGATPALLAGGIPDAAYRPAAGDDPAVARAWRAANRAERAAGPVPEATGAAADAWCAAFLAPKRRGATPITHAALLGGSPEAVAAALAERRPLHWPLAVAEAAGGFDAVVGNPPFLNRLERATAPDRRVAALVRARHGDAAPAYADAAWLFLALALELVRPGGRVALVQPQSLLAARDAAPARRAVLRDGRLVALWVAGEKVFDAAVLVCAPVVERGAAGGAPVRRLVGAGLREVAPAPLRPGGTWGSLAAEAFGLPPCDLRAAGTLAAHAQATADFRDQFYGLVPFLVEDDDVDDEERYVRLVTTGLVDPARCLWGRRATRVAGRVLQAPRVDLVRLRAESALGPWASRRLVPKLLLPTQTRVLEPVVDQAGAWLPCTPLITVAADRPWHVAAALASPPLAAWALAEHAGAALTADAIKLSASQVAALPAPAVGPAWDAGAEAFRAAAAATDEPAWRAALQASAVALCEAFAVAEPAPVLAWWASRLPPWR